MTDDMRITMRNGEVRSVYSNGKSLPELWGIWKTQGCVVTREWCAQFDDIAHVDVMRPAPTGDNSKERDALEQAQADAQLGALERSMAAGVWRPPEKV